MEEKVANKGNNKKEKNKFQSGFKPQKGQKSELNKEKGGGRAGTLCKFSQNIQSYIQLQHGRLRRKPRSLIMSEERKEK